MIDKLLKRLYNIYMVDNKSTKFRTVRVLNMFEVNFFSEKVEKVEREMIKSFFRFL